MPSPPSSNLDEVLQKTTNPEKVILCFFHAFRALADHFPHYLENVCQIVENLLNRDTIRTTVVDCFRTLLEFLRQTADDDLVVVFNGVMYAWEQEVQFSLNSSQTTTTDTKISRNWRRRDGRPTDGNSKMQSALSRSSSAASASSQHQPETSERQNSVTQSQRLDSNQIHETDFTGHQNAESIPFRHSSADGRQVSISVESLADDSGDASESADDIPNVQVEPQGDNGIDVSLTWGDRTVTINLNSMRNQFGGATDIRADAGARGRIPRSNSSVESTRVLHDHSESNRPHSSIIDQRRPDRRTLSPIERPWGSIIVQNLPLSRSVFLSIDQNRSSLRAISPREASNTEIPQWLQGFINEVPRRPDNFGNEVLMRPQNFGIDVPRGPENFGNEGLRIPNIFGNDVLRRPEILGNGVSRSPENFGDETWHRDAQLSGMTRVRSEPGYPQELSPDATFINSSATDRNNLTDDGIRAFVDIPYGEELHEEEEDQ